MRIKRILTVVDTHTGGEPTRIVLSGGPMLRGNTMLDRWQEFRLRHDDLREFLMREPRGHGDMFGALVTTPCSDGAHCGVIFMDPSGCLTMCGHGSIGLARTLLELRMVESNIPCTHVILDTPAGVVRVLVDVQEDGQVGAALLGNVPSFLYAEDLKIRLSDGTDVTLDVAFGGNFFAIVPAGQLGLSIEPGEARRIQALGLEIRELVNLKIRASHPEEDRICGVELVEFSLQEGERRYRNCVVFGQGAIDRSPCGTGTSAKMAVLAAKGELRPGEEFVHRGITGSVFTGYVEEGPKISGFQSVLPFVKGTSSITGFNMLIQEEGDVFPRGFLLGR
ncbi:proline racemase [Thermanaerovibrio velox DSM 12556]|uniref:Proline racemase n=1 Tax=Thermanaerovibrio velox DSM 12556 TaxID=926567 RepID=H0UNQ2_9BACT|nr:proline racemase family protein [Thermanaerovibrio velox]EHM10467.1 proline racemase [Thermanaerovibrio velox DSM 12556]